MSRSAAVTSDAQMAVVGGGVVGAAVACALARRGVAVVLVEAEDGWRWARAARTRASFTPGSTRRPGSSRRDCSCARPSSATRSSSNLGVPVLRCGAVLEAADRASGATISGACASAHVPTASKRRLARGRARGAGRVDHRSGRVHPGAGRAARALGAEIRTGFRVAALERGDGAIRLAEPGGELRGRTDRRELRRPSRRRRGTPGGRRQTFTIYPARASSSSSTSRGPLERILLPLPTKRTKGVWCSHRGRQGDRRPDRARSGGQGGLVGAPEAADDVLPKARRMSPPLESAEPIAGYAGLRPAGRGVNYLIGPPLRCPGLINVAAIRSTGLSASLGIARARRRRSWASTG